MCYELLEIDSGCKRLRVVISECCHNSSIHGKSNWFSEYLENNNIKKNAQCVNTIALICSPKIGNDRLLTMGAITYSREFIG